MSASGASSAKRSRSMLSTGVPTASDRTWAISSSAAISSSDKTAVVGARSAAARSSYRLVSATGRRMRGATTTVPRPRRRTTRPCWTSRWIACRTVGRLTPSCSASSSSLSSRSPGALVPAWIASLRFSAIWKYSGIGLVRSSGGLRLALVSMGTSVGDAVSGAILSLPPYILLTGHKGGFMFSFDSAASPHGGSMTYRIKGAIALLGAALLVAACSSSPSSSSSATGSHSSGSGSSAASSSGGCPYTFALITHGDNGSFWSVVYKGAKNAAADLGCKLSEVYGSQQQGQAQPDDNAENAQIQDAINAHVAGIAVSDHDPSLMNSTIAKAGAAGIPVITLNAGCDPTDLAASNALTCFGQTESLAGTVAGAKFKSQGATNVLCVIHQSGQNLLDRCNGIAQGLGVGTTCSTKAAPAHGPACTEIILSTPNAASNPPQAIGQVTAYLQAHPGITAVMTLNPAISDALVTAHPSGVKIGTFDLDSTVVSDLKAGTLDFAIDQQQYLQGYLPIVSLYLYKKHEGNTVGPATVVPTGPLVVTGSNVSTVQAAIAAGDD